MAPKLGKSKLPGELVEFLRPGMPGVEVEVNFSERWKRESVTFSWAGFAGLLPEERFHRLTQVIPNDFREQHLAGFVWLELAPGETVDQFLSYPRSEDIAPREDAVYDELVQLGFFDAIDADLGPAPDKACAKDFARTIQLLEEEGFSSEKIRDAKLVFIRHGAYCDCQVLFTAQQELAELHAGVE